MMKNPFYQKSTGSLPNQRLDPLNYNRVNELHPGRYGDLSAPWIQRKHFQYHNLSAVPLNGNASQYYLKQLNDQYSRNPQQQNNQQYGYNGQNSERDYIENQQNLISPQHQYNYDQNPRNNYDEEYFRRFQEFKEKKQKELENQIQRERQEYQKIMQAQEKIIPKQQEIINPQNQQIFNEKKNIHQIQYQNNHNIQTNQNFNLQNLNQKQNKIILPPLEQLDYKQRYKLNESLYNPQYSVINQIFPNHSEIYPKQKYPIAEIEPPIKNQFQKNQSNQITQTDSSLKEDYGLIQQPKYIGESLAKQESNIQMSTPNNYFQNQQQHDY